jgi:hypothetical protein
MSCESSIELANLIKKINRDPRVIEGKKREADFLKKTDQYVPSYNYDILTGELAHAEDPKRVYNGDALARSTYKIGEFNDQSFVRRNRNRR